MTRTKILLSDIEGTTSPLSYTHAFLFPYIREKMGSVLEAELNANTDLQNLCLRLLKTDDISAVTVDAVKAKVKEMMDRDSKETELKEFQAFIWARGFARDELYGIIYEDVIKAFKEQPVYIYSSGSVATQKLVFRNAKVESLGKFYDLSQYIYGYFDTRNAGNKKQKESYAKIIEEIKKQRDIVPEDILFASDSVEELEAASAVGIQCLLVDRDGTGLKTNFKTVTSFDDI